MSSKTEKTTYETYKDQYSNLIAFFRAVDTMDQLAIKPVSNNEEELHVLNNRLDQFMKKVQSLEQRKAKLEKEVHELKSRPSQGSTICEDKRKKLQTELNEEKIKYVKLQIKYDELQGLYSKERSAHEQTEARIEKYKKNQEDATAKNKRLKLSMHSWMDSLKKSQQVINDLSKEQQLPPGQVKQFEEKVKASKKEAEELKILLEIKITELKSLQKTKENLEKENEKIELDHKTEIEHYQQMMSKHTEELSQTQSDMTKQRLAYQDLKHDKNTLEKEIEKYRNLLEAGEGHIKTLQQTKDKEEHSKVAVTLKTNETITKTTTTTIKK